jgi:hypothetical protein
MARLAQRVMVEAREAFRTADDLGAAMAPHLLQQVSNSAIYQYTRPGTGSAKLNVPRGDVLLAAALAAGLSLDEKLGMARQANDIEMLRAQLAEMREEMAYLRAIVAGDNAVSVTQPTASDVAASRADRANRRRAWAERSQAAISPGPHGPIRRADRTGGR